jgi:hypothetical protein
MQAIVCLKCVRFKLVVPELFDVCDYFFNLQRISGIVPVLTGAAYENYPVDSLHAMGYAWDFRSYQYADPESVFLGLQDWLAKISWRYRCLYHDTGTGMHYHIEYRVTLPDKKH